MNDGNGGRKNHIRWEGETKRKREKEKGVREGRANERGGRSRKDKINS